MESICGTCILSAGCAFVKLMSGRVVECRTYMDTNLSKEEKKAAMVAFMADPSVLTKDDIKVVLEGV